MGGQVLGQEGSHQLQGHGLEAGLSHGRDSLAEVLGLVRADGVYGGQHEPGGRRGRVGQHRAAQVSCRGGGAGGNRNKLM